MVQRSPVVWLNEHRAAASAAAAATVIALVAATCALTGGGDDISSELVEPGGATADDASGGAEGGDGSASSDGTSSGTTGGGTSTARIALPTLEDLSKGKNPAKACAPRSVKQTGITDSTIRIGQITTEANQLPQQLGPAREGLQAYVELINAAGGLCGRKLELDTRNDTLNPAVHNGDAQELAETTFAFVANESLLDSLDYEQNPPFEPTVTDGGEKVPDVGGLAFAYGRSQSRWHAGVIGSVSPVLVGGGQFKYFVNEAKQKGTPCTKGGVVYLAEPTGASEDQARLGQVALEASWGANLGSGNTELYFANLADPVTAYQILVQRMVADGVNCVFTYTDLGSSINLVLAMEDEGVWPPKSCSLGPLCFRVVYIPLSAYDPGFVQGAGDASLDVSTFIPHLPLNEIDRDVMKTYLAALKKIPGAEPSTFSVIGFASGQLFVEGLAACVDAPTRSCLMDGLRKMKGFTSGGLLGGTTPFKTTKVTYDRFGTHDWKWIFNHTVAMRVLDRGKRDFYRVNPGSGFLEDTLKVARGTAG